MWLMDPGNSHEAWFKPPRSSELTTVSPVSADDNNNTPTHTGSLGVESRLNYISRHDLNTANTRPILA